MGKFWFFQKTNFKVNKCQQCQTFRSYIHKDNPRFKKDAQLKSWYDVVYKRIRMFADVSSDQGVFFNHVCVSYFHFLIENISNNFNCWRVALIGVWKECQHPATLGVHRRSTMQLAEQRPSFRSGSDTQPEQSLNLWDTIYKMGAISHACLIINTTWK